MSWIDKAKENQIEATLEALEVASLRHLPNYKEKFLELSLVLRNIKSTNPYIKKLQNIYSTITPELKEEKFNKWWE